MKKTLGITVFLISLTLYVIFIHENREIVAREWRCYTIYQEYQATEKYIGYSTTSYDNDIYNLKTIKNNIQKETVILERYQKKLNLYNDSINLIQNTILDYNRYIINIKKTKSNIETQKEIREKYVTDLLELDKFISKLEPNILSIRKYQSEMKYLMSIIKFVDEKTSDCDVTLDLIKKIAISKRFFLNEEIKKEKELEEQIILAKIQLEIEVEKQKYIDNYEYSRNYYQPTYSSNNSNFDYLKYENVQNYNFAPSDYQQSIPDVSNYSSSFYSTNTNPNHVEVDGYYKSNGTYVEPHVRTAPNTTIIDNFSTSPNLNPYTGKIGTIKY